MKKIVLLVLVLMLSLSGMIGRFVRPVAAYPSIHCQNIAHEGNIIVNGSDTFTIENCEFTQYGKIMVQDDATLFIRNAKLILKDPLDIHLTSHSTIIVKDQANLTIINATIILDYSVHGIYIQDEARATVLNSNITALEYAGMVAKSNATIQMENSDFRSNGTDWDSHCVLAAFDGGMVRVCNSTLDEVNTARKSTLIVQNSIISKIASASDNSTLQIENCAMLSGMSVHWGSKVFVNKSTMSSSSYIQDATIRFEDCSLYSVYGSTGSTVWIIRSSVSKVAAYSDSTIWLIDSHAKSIGTYQKANVFVGWTLPVLGTVTVPHTWIPIIQAIAILAIIVSAGVIIYFIRKQVINRAMKRSFEKELRAAIYAISLKQ